MEGIGYFLQRETEAMKKRAKENPNPTQQEISNSFKSHENQPGHIRGGPGYGECSQDSFQQQIENWNSNRSRPSWENQFGGFPSDQVSF